MSVKHDCGRHGQLTAREISSLTGLDVTSIRKRVHAGWKGSELCLSARGRPIVKREQPRFSTMVIAMKLVRAFDDFETVPSIEDIRRCHAMARSTAARWRWMFRRAMEGTK